MHTEIRSAALGTLIILQLTMLAALLFKLPPHPPDVIPIGGMGPVIGMSISAACAALVFRGEGRSGKALILCACLLAAISYGPQKFFDPAIGLVWPAVVTAQLAIIALVVPIGRAMFARN
ncbi:hypothetical protein [uncultured Roseobacter sp.]|uniref:hypothetical protein n=1 Tax=uncultured Roseobacter sp. TaxID=114847 RepID=UPI00263991A3|nr:hypothetical protein [uncultured Roseobacter sp.]